MSELTPHLEHPKFEALVRLLQTLREKQIPLKIGYGIWIIISDIEDSPSGCGQCRDVISGLRLTGTAVRHWRNKYHEADEFYSKGNRRMVTCNVGQFDNHACQCNNYEVNDIFRFRGFMGTKSQAFKNYVDFRLLIKQFHIHCS